MNSIDINPICMIIAKFLKEQTQIKQCNNISHDIIINTKELPLLTAKTISQDQINYFDGSLAQHIISIKIYDKTHSQCLENSLLIRNTLEKFTLLSQHEKIHHLRVEPSTISILKNKKIWRSTFKAFINTIQKAI